MSNSIQIVPREMADAKVEGINFSGKPMWVIARSPKAVLVYVYGSMYWSGRSNQNYAPGHLTLFPDRGPCAVIRLEYKRLWEGGNKRRFDHNVIGQVNNALVAMFGEYGTQLIRNAVKHHKTVIFEGGGGQLKPPGLFGHAHKEWRDRGNGFLVLPEGMSEHDACRHKAGWKPQGAS